MKILQINSVCGTGSTGKIVADIYHIIKKNGHECRIAYGRGDAIGIEKSDIIKIGSFYDVLIHAMGTRLTDKTGFYSKKSTSAFIKKIKEYNPDIIHIHNIHGYYINIEQLFNYIKRNNKKVVWTFHDCWPFTGHCAYFEKIKCDKWKTMCKNCRARKSYPLSLRDNSVWNYNKKKQLFTNTDLHIVTPSLWMANKVRQSFLKENNITVIYNGINTDIFRPYKNDLKRIFKIEDKKIILGVANIWDARKGLDDFIKLEKELDHERYQIVLVGVNRKQMKALSHNIICIERTENQQELAKIYSAADVFFNPTHTDNFPTVNLEALACGTPVATYNTGGSPEAIDNNTGVIVDPNNVMEDLNKIILNEKKYLEEACVQRAHLFDRNNAFSKYIKLYEDILK